MNLIKEELKEIIGKTIKSASLFEDENDNDTLKIVFDDDFELIVEAHGDYSERFGDSGYINLKHK